MSHEYEMLWDIYKIIIHKKEKYFMWDERRERKKNGNEMFAILKMYWCIFCSVKCNTTSKCWQSSWCRMNRSIFIFSSVSLLAFSFPPPLLLGLKIFHGWRKIFFFHLFSSFFIWILLSLFLSVCVCVCEFSGRKNAVSVW